MTSRARSELRLESIDPGSTDFRLVSLTGTHKNKLSPCLRGIRSQRSKALLATCYMHCRQHYRVPKLLRGTKDPHCRYLLAQCFMKLPGKMYDARMMLMPANDKNQACHPAVTSLINAGALDPIPPSAFDEQCRLHEPRRLTKAQSMYMRMSLLGLCSYDAASLRGQLLHVHVACNRKGCHTSASSHLGQSEDGCLMAMLAAGGLVYMRPKV